MRDQRSPLYIVFGLTLPLIFPPISCPPRSLRFFQIKLPSCVLLFLLLHHQQISSPTPRRAVARSSPHLVLRLLLFLVLVLVLHKHSSCQRLQRLNPSRIENVFILATNVSFLATNVFIPLQMGASTYILSLSPERRGPERTLTQRGGGERETRGNRPPLTQSAPPPSAPLPSGPPPSSNPYVRLPTAFPQPSYHSCPL